VQSVTHLDENNVVDFLGGLLAPEARARIEDHIDRCPDCRRLLAGAGAVSRTEPSQETPPKPVLPRIGDVLAERFRLKRALGKGAMGVVYEADDELVGVRVALKVLLRHDVIHRLEREVVLGRRITHPHVCRIYDLFRHEALCFIAMEYVEGETLEERLARGPISPPTARVLLDEIAAAVEAAHEEGIVHRDLKPQNVMLDPEGRVKVMDFGLALDLAVSESRRSGPVGTPAYWAPEQARGEPITAAADVYSLGLIAYRLLAERSYRLADPAALDHVPRRFRKVVRRALEPQPNKRYRDAKELRAALSAIK
jgi:eukaryotic-like serine/threonine-protein kinase